METYVVHTRTLELCRTSNPEMAIAVAVANGMYVTSQTPESARIIKNTATALGAAFDEISGDFLIFSKDTNLASTILTSIRR